MSGLLRAPCWRNAVLDCTCQCDCEAILDRGCVQVSWTVFAREILQSSPLVKKKKRGVAVMLTTPANL